MGTIMVGGLAGWVGGLVLNPRHSRLFNIMIGLGGSVIGALIARQFRIHILPGLASSLALSTLAALVLLAVWGLFRRRG